MKQPSLRGIDRRWTWVLGAGVAALALLTVRSFLREEAAQRDLANTTKSARSSSPTVLCADGTRSNILTRTAQEDACADHGGIRKLLVPPYRPAQRSQAPAASVPATSTLRRSPTPKGSPQLPQPSANKAKA